MIRVLVADDHAVVRRGLANLLAGWADFAVVGEARDGVEAVALATRLQPDVVLMDASMPGLSGIEATREVARVAPDARVVMLTSFSERERVLGAIDAGAVGYLLKDAEPDEIARGVLAAAAGASPLSPRAAQVLVAGRAAAAEPPDVRLSGRELEVLELLHTGLPNKQISRRLGIAEKTVKTHLTNIFQRIGVLDRTQAALWYERHAGAARVLDDQ